MVMSVEFISWLNRLPGARLREFTHRLRRGCGFPRMLEAGSYPEPEEDLLEDLEDLGNENGLEKWDAVRRSYETPRVRASPMTA